MICFFQSRNNYRMKMYVSQGWWQSWKWVEEITSWEPVLNEGNLLKEIMLETDHKFRWCGVVSEIIDWWILKQIIIRSIFVYSLASQMYLYRWKKRYCHVAHQIPLILKKRGRNQSPTGTHFPLLLCSDLFLSICIVF